ncbi:MAG: hypothetical protein WDN46_08265 [Methylocella sp.]
MIKKYVALIGILCIGSWLAGCAKEIAEATGAVNTVATQVASDVPTACALLQGADASFQTIAATQAGVGKPLAASVISDESAAVAGVDQLCANPAAFTSVAGTLSTALSAYAAVMKALAAAQTAAGK